MGTKTKCQKCGKELDYSAKFDDPRHVFNIPTDNGFIPVCRECFRKKW